MTRALPLLLLLALLRPASPAEEPLQTAPDRPVDVRHIALDLQVDLEQRALTGVATLDLVARAPVTRVRLDAIDHTIQGVARLRGADAEPLRFDYDGEHLDASLGLRRGEAARLEVRYQVRDPRAGLFFFGPSDDDPRVPWQVWSQGETTFNRYWFPSVDHPSERQTTSMTVTVKDGLTVISNGASLGVEKTPDGRATWRFRQDREHPSYLVSLVVGKFAVARDTWKGKSVSYYVPPEHEADIARSFARTPAMLEFFSRRFGTDYPWAKYDQVVVEQFDWGGMENTSATTLNDYTLHDERAHLDFSSEGLVAHELGHQWFGDLITCRDWSHLWLNESFATYAALLWTEFERGPDEFARELLGTADGGRRAGKDRPILDRRYPNPDSMFDGRAYPKGACVLHMLRRQLGEEAFWEGIRSYVERNQGQSVATVDLRRALEEASGRDLERMFADWLETPGVPAVRVSLEQDGERGLVLVKVEQTQDHHLYRLPVEVRLDWGGRQERREVLLNERQATIAFLSSEMPTRFRCDPREQLLLAEVTEQKPRGMWVAQLAEDDARGRLLAARALGEDRHPEARLALLQALSRDGFWAVQEACAEALGKHPGPEAREALVAALRGAADARVRRACARALGQRGRDAAAAEALATVLREGDASYFVEAEAVEAYIQAAEDPSELLYRQLEKPSHNEVIRGAALRAISVLERPGAVGLILPFLAPTTDYGLRQTAARCLGAAASKPGVSEADQSAAVAALCQVLGKAGRRARRAALDGLEAMGGRAQGALGVVEVAARRDPDGRVRDQATRVAERIRAGSAPDAELARLRGELARLRQAHDELQGRLDKLEARDGAERR